jgi:hypothetical protein
MSQTELCSDQPGYSLGIRMLPDLLLARCDGLLHALGGARSVGLHLGKVSSRRLLGDNHVVELVLGDDVDGVRVCER